MTPRHGTRFGYREDRCKCDSCRKAIALDHNLYKMRRQANGGAPLTVDKLGAVRRLQALMALGWPRRDLARMAGYQGDALALILNGRRQRLELATDEKIRDLYDRLSMTLGPSSSSRIRAAKKGWATPLCWDDIDTDPAPRGQRSRSYCDYDSAHILDEATVIRVLAGENLPTNRAEKTEIMRRWLASGQSERSLCERLGWRDGRYTPRRDGAA